MFVAVVLAHPSPDSYCHALAARAASGLRAGGHTVEVLDLYGEQFTVAMTAAERHAYHGEEPILDPLVARHADIVQRAGALVFVYPTWWSGLPAILKGWLERVMVPGVAFRFDERTDKVRPALGNVAHIVGISTYGSPKRYVRIINDNGRRTLTRALRMSCGHRTKTHWLGLYALDTSSATQRTEFAAQVERTMADLR
jgi:NAD(P)H dehydrogenase (quinone)